MNNNNSNSNSNNIFLHLWRNNYLKENIKRYFYPIYYQYSHKDVSFTIDTIDAFNSNIITLFLKDCNVNVGLELPNTITKLSVSGVRNVFDIKLPRSSITILELVEYEGVIPEYYIPSSVKNLKIKGPLEYNAIPYGVEKIEIMHCNEKFKIPLSVVEMTIVNIHESINIPGWIPEGIELMHVNFVPFKGFIPQSVKQVFSYMSLSTYRVLPQSINSRHMLMIIQLYRVNRKYQNLSRI